MPKIFYVVIVLVVLVPICGNLISGKFGKNRKEFDLSSVKRREPLTVHEKKMFQLLKVALPDYTVLAQVAFSSLITAKIRPVRNRFDRKVADFVICSKALKVIAIIELDDSSHRGREKQDKDRDHLLAVAGYTTIRYAGLPAIATVQHDISKLSEMALPVR